MTSPDTPDNPRPRKRRIQERTALARNNLIAAATPMFSEQGFDAVSVRDIENEAKVKRGMLAYHFGNKDNLWKVVADGIFSDLISSLSQRQEVLKDMSKREGMALLIRFHVRYYAQHPELSRLMSQEARQDTWRIQYLVDKHKLPTVSALKTYIMDGLGLSETEYAHWYYIMVSASATMFSFEPECRLMFGFNPREPSVVDTHAEMMVNMLLKDYP